MVAGRKRNILASLRGVAPLLWLSPLKLVSENLGVYGLNVLQLWERGDILEGAFEDLVRGANEGVYRPVVDRTFPLEQAGEAHRYLHDRRNIGKVVLVTGE